MKVNFKLDTLNEIQKDLKDIYMIKVDPMRGYRVDELLLMLHEVDKTISDMIKKEIELNEFNV